MPIEWPPTYVICPPGIGHPDFEPHKKYQRQFPEFAHDVDLDADADPDDDVVGK